MRAQDIVWALVLQAAVSVISGCPGNLSGPIERAELPGLRKLASYYMRSASRHEVYSRSRAIRRFVKFDRI